MNQTVRIPRHVRKSVSLDVVSKSPNTPPVHGNTRSSSRDFLSKPLQSTVFLRGRRVPCRERFDGEVAHRRSIDDIRLRTSSPRVTLNAERSLRSSLRHRYASWLLKLEMCIVRGGGFLALSPRFALRLSLVGAIFLGVASTVLSYRYLGERALAREESRNAAKVTLDRPATMPESPAVLGASDHVDERFVNEVTDDLKSLRDVEQKEMLEAKVREMVAGYPIEDMVPYIVEKDTIVAAFLVGIAKKESAWGKRVPLLKSHDCFNYWGYRGKRRFMGTGGHTCFNSPKDAVDTVSRRLEKLIYSEKVDTPAEMMVVWKCGYDCSTHDKADTKKWIQDVDLYFHQLDE